MDLVQAAVEFVETSEQKSSAWPVSYSVSSQGASPLHAPKAADDAEIPAIELENPPKSDTSVVIHEAQDSAVDQPTVTSQDEPEAAPDDSAAAAEAVGLHSVDVIYGTDSCNC